MLQGIRKIHFIGVGGAGMSALARILLDKGYEVSGSDKKMSATAEQLAERGAKIFEGHDAANVKGADAVVVSTAIPENNVEVTAAKSQGIQIMHRSDVNAALLNVAKGIAVAGAHGKTTTTSMIGLILEHGGVDRTIIIGGQVDYLADGNARLGHGEYLVSEADESDGSSFNWSEYLNGPKMDGSNPNEFVQLTFKYAREYFAANGGNESSLKFFINEDGLDNSAKLNGLTKLLTTWEQDKSVKFDGISTSLKASFSENESTYTSEKTKVENFLKALAGTGRLIRISGIDVDYKDASGAAVEAAKLTVEQAKKMGEFYKYIAQQYKTLIPDNQKAGLYISNIFDNGNISGLWNKTNNSRKPQYGGFAEGLE